MADKPTVMTSSGLKRMQDELLELQTHRRTEVAEKIKEARGQGDLSENAEYDAAKDEQAEIEARISVIEATLKNVEVIDEQELDTTTVRIGSKVKVLDCEFDEEEEYKIVGSTEADPFEGRISNESPLGTALLGKMVNEDVEVKAPEGTIKYKVLSIEVPKLD